MKARNDGAFFPWACHYARSRVFVPVCKRSSTADTDQRFVSVYLFPPPPHFLLVLDTSLFQFLTALVFGLLRFHYQRGRLKTVWIWSCFFFSSFVAWTLRRT